MISQKSYSKQFIALFFVLILLMLLNVSLGSVSIPFTEIIDILLGGNSTKPSWDIIVIHFRFPKAITAILVGSGLAISGLLMQTLFRNPLAGPFVLGISSGASLGVALLILGSSIFGGILATIAFSNWGIAIASSTGAALVLFAVIITANKVRNTMSILIIGLMFGTVTSAIISVLTFFSNADKIQKFIFWGFGNLGNLSWNEVMIFFIIYLIGMINLVQVIKPLNTFLLGENYSKSLGIHIKRSRMIILLITSLLTGVITAFAGPIAFIGLAVPHITKLLFKTSNHKILLPAVAILGAIILLVCDLIAQLPTSEFTLPLNAVTSLFGAPIVIWLLIRKKKIYV
ncbi:MAG: Hemin transport system permease protein HmuU [Flavobacterium sp. SCGC AAA160-P02]|nr:MAG: Hemin transport system permease protein HmuU [Flavobacterium sp. SCGC AAA160-P02]